MEDQTENLDQQYYEKAWARWNDQASFGPASRHIRRLVLKMISGLNFSTLLDAGCGDGTLIKQIHENYPIVELTGVDFSEKGIESARQNNPKVKILQLDLTRQSLPQKFDLVTCVDVLEHIEDDQTVLKNLHQLTARYLLLVVPIGPLFKQERIRNGHVHGYSRDEIKLKLDLAGYRVIKEIAWGFPIFMLYRRLVMHMPEDTVSGNFDWKKRLIANITYILLFINLPFWGDRYHVLCHA